MGQKPGFEGSVLPGHPLLIPSVLVMNRTVRLLACALALSACSENVQSRQQTEMARVDSQAVLLRNDDIMRSRQNAITRAVESASPAVVSVNVVQRIQYRDPFADPFFDFFFGGQRSRVREQQVQSMGSGFVISADGYIVTNEHVTGMADEITVAFPDGRSLPAKLIGKDAASDLALLKVEPDGELPYLSFSTSGEPIVGEWCIALGNPFGLFQAADPSVTVGVVSAKGRDLAPQDGRVYRDMIQTDAAINRGNSGGPLLNALGEVIGVNTAIVSPAGGSVGIGFAVPHDRVLRIIDELRDKGFVDRSYYTGLQVRDVNARVAQALGLAEARGVFIENVEPGSPGAVAGLQTYDVILAVDGDPIQGQSDIMVRMYDIRPGDVVRFTVIRNGRPEEVSLRLGSTPGS